MAGLGFRELSRPIKLVGSRKLRIDNWQLGVITKRYQREQQKNGDEGRAQERGHQMKHSGKPQQSSTILGLLQQPPAPTACFHPQGAEATILIVDK